REATAFAELTASAPQPSANGKGKGSPDLIEAREFVPVTRHAERPHIMATATTPWGRSAPQKVPATRSDPPTPTASWTSGADNRPAVIDDADFSGYDDLRG